MKYLIRIVCILLITDVNAQFNGPAPSPSNPDTCSKGMTVLEMIQKHRHIKKGCIALDTAISAMKEVKNTQQDIIAKLREMKERKLASTPAQLQ